jgi:hypothetical protein
MATLAVSIVLGSQPTRAADTQPPDLACGADKFAQCGDDWSFDIPTAKDEIDGANVLIEVVSTVTNVAAPRCPILFSVTRTWRATDTSTNSSFCNQTVTIVDTQPPNITCEQDKEVQCGTDWSFDIPTAVDKCDLNNVLIEVVATVTNVAAPRGPRIFSVTRTWRATDTCGNASFCNQTVTVVDTEPPDITCGPDKYAECGDGWSFDIPTAMDKCDLNNVLIEVVATVTNVAAPRCPRIFSVTRTWRATDTCGNAAFCNQTVTVVDTEPPQMMCGQDKQVQCGSNWTFDLPTAVDKCDLTNVLIEVVATVTNVAIPRCPLIFSVTRTWRATDTCGNASFCNQTVSVVDTLPPVITCLSNLTVSCLSDVPPCPTSLAAFLALGGTAIDNCDANLTYTCSDSALVGGACSGTISRTHTVTDDCTNSASCVQLITVSDITPPTITGVSVDKSSLWPPNHKMQDVLVSYTATDNCDTNLTNQLIVTSNEPINGTGDGDTVPDWEVVDDHHVRLRAERAGTGTGRIYTIAIVSSDCSGNSTTNPVFVVVAHDIKSPVSGAAFKVNTTVNFAGTFWDAPGNKHTAYWTFDGLSTPGAVTEPSGLKNGVVKGGFRFKTPGVYKVTMFVKDQNGVTSWVNTAGDVESIVVIYDPNAGYTIGGGWINSPPGAYALDPNLAGKLSFGFSSQYFKGAANPKGETLVNFLVGDLEFNALNFDYLSISGAKAQFKGFGKINGASGYNFILTVIDGALATDGVGRFRIKIWEKTTGTIIYDNEPGRSDADDPTTAVGAASSVTIKK